MKKKQTKSPFIFSDTLFGNLGFLLSKFFRRFYGRFLGRVARYILISAPLFFVTFSSSAVAVAQEGRRKNDSSRGVSSPEISSGDVSSRGDSSRDVSSPRIVAELREDLDKGGPDERLVLESDGTLRIFSGKVLLKKFSFGVGVPGKVALSALSGRRNKSFFVHIRAEYSNTTRALEAILFGPSMRKLRLVWSGFTGPMGRDSEYETHFDVGDRWILLYQSMRGLKRCDGKKPRFFLRALDYKSGRMRPITSIPKTKGLDALTAEPEPPKGFLGSAGLSPLMATYTSTSLGDGEVVTGIKRPHALDDGNAATAWIEGKGGFGLGEFIEYRGAESPYKIVGIKFLPGHGGSLKAFREHNRVKSLVVNLGGEKSFLISLPRDPLETIKERLRRGGGIGVGGGDGEVGGGVKGDEGGSGEGGTESGSIVRAHGGADKFLTTAENATYWVLFPQPIKARCATVVLRSAYFGERGGKWGEGGRTAISELSFLSELDLEGGVVRLLKDVEKGAVTGDSAFSMLKRLGPQAVGRVREAMKGAGGEGRSVAVRALLELDPGRSMKSLVRALPGLTRSLQDRVLNKALNERDSIVPELSNLLRLKGVSLELKLKVLGTLREMKTKSAGELLFKELGKGARSYRRAVVDAMRVVSPGVFKPLDFKNLVSKENVAVTADRIWAAGHLAEASPAYRMEIGKRLISVWRRLGDTASFEVRMRLIQAMGRSIPLEVGAREPGETRLKAEVDDKPEGKREEKPEDSTKEKTENRAASEEADKNREKTAESKKLHHNKVTSKERAFTQSLLKILERVVSEADEELFRWAAVRALGESGHSRGREIIAGAGKDSDPRVRVEALSWLAATNDPRAGKTAVFCALEDPWSWVRVQCLRVVAQKCPPGGGEHLLSAWKVGAGPSKGVLLYNMAVCRYSGARELLHKVVLKHGDNPGLAAYAARLLPRVGDLESARILLSAAVGVLEEAHPHTRKERLFVDLLESLQVFFVKSDSKGAGNAITLKKGDAKKTDGTVSLEDLRRGVIALSKKALKNLGDEGVSRSDKLQLAIVRVLSTLCPGPDVAEELKKWKSHGLSQIIKREAIKAQKKCDKIQ